MAILEAGSTGIGSEKKDQTLLELTVELSVASGLLRVAINSIICQHPDSSKEPSECESRPDSVIDEIFNLSSNILDQIRQSTRLINNDIAGKLQ